VLATTVAVDDPEGILLPFRDVYGILGEELEIATERIVNTIVSTPARGFSSGTASI
jgi:hypothetical protein